MSDFALFERVCSVDAAVEKIQRFYRRYHSLRYVRGQLVIRLASPLDRGQASLLAEQFQGFFLDLRPQSSLILINGNHPMFLERTQALADHRRRGHGLKAFAIKKQRVFMLRGNCALHWITPWA